jgi:hypothetical protein
LPSRRAAHTRHTSFERREVLFGELDADVVALATREREPFGVLRSSISPTT